MLYPLEIELRCRRVWLEQLSGFDPHARASVFWIHKNLIFAIFVGCQLRHRVPRFLKYSRIKNPCLRASVPLPIRSRPVVNAFVRFLDIPRTTELPYSYSRLHLVRGTLRSNLESPRTPTGGLPKSHRSRRQRIPGAAFAALAGLLTEPGLNRDSPPDGSYQQDMNDRCPWRTCELPLLPGAVEVHVHFHRWS